MKRYLKPSLVSIFVFSLSCVLLSHLKVKPEAIVGEINVLVPEDDDFQLFYLLEGIDDFSDDQCVTAEVSGRSQFQKIRFNIPVDNAITAFRIGLGNNVHQNRLEIETIRLKSWRKTFEYHVPEAFVPNMYITIKDGIANLRKIDDQYNPYLTSNFDVKAVVESLASRQRALAFWVVIILSLILSFSAFYVIDHDGFRFRSWGSNPFILVFLAILFAPLFVKIFDLDLDSTATEKRELAPKPKFELSRDYPQRYENYFNDHFGLRSLLVSWNSKMKMDIFKVSPNPTMVLFGKNGFLFYNAEIDGIYSSYSHRNIADEPTLEAAYQKQLKMKRDLAERNVEYIVGFFPNKHTIYKDYLPFSMRMQVKGDTSLSDQLVDYFGSRDFPLVDIRSDLLEASKERQIYYKFDTHWNLYGAYLAYRSLCEQTYDVIGLTPYDTSYFDIQYSQSRRGDLTHIMGISEMKSYYDEIPNFHLKAREMRYGFMTPYGFPPKTIITINESVHDPRTLLVYRDSFTEALIPLISLHFHKVIYVWGDTIDMNLIDRARPDIVFFLCVERYLPHYFKTGDLLGGH